MNKKNIIVLAFLCFVLFGIQYTNTHADKIASAKAEYYYKKNDIPRAMEQLEKAFEYGNVNYNQRDWYINSIINTPFNTNSQEKLVKFLNYPIEDSARLKAEHFLTDFKREINKKYPDNYITQAVFNQQLMRWGKIPVTYGFENEKNVPDYFPKEIENAFTQWEIATNHQILFTREDKSPDIIIKFNPENPADTEVKKYVVAYTAPVVITNKLKNMVINFYLKDPNGEFFSQNQVYNTALHEIVHALGFMGHSNNRKNIMYLTKDSMSVIQDKREELTEADINTVKLLYKIKPEITNIEKPSGEYIPYLVLGNDKEINTAKIKEARTYIKKAPGIAAGYIDLAESYVATNNYSKAIKSLEKALELSDTDELRSMVYFNLAVSYFYIGHMEIAYDYLQQSIQIKDSEEKHLLLAEIYSKDGKTSKAISEYKSLIRQNPKNIDYTVGLTNIYINDKKYMSARKVLKEFFAHNPKERNNPRFEPYGIIKLFL